MKKFGLMFTDKSFLRRRGGGCTTPGYLHLVARITLMSLVTVFYRRGNCTLRSLRGQFVGEIEYALTTGRRLVAGMGI